MDTHIQKELKLRDLLQIYRRRRNVVYGVLLTVFVLTAIFCIVCPRRYEATSTLQIQKEGAGDAMGLENLMSNVGAGAGDVLDANVELETQSDILQSETLAIRTIEALQLQNTPDFVRRQNPLSWFLELISPAGPSDPPNAGLEGSPQRRQRLVKIFSKNLKVEPVAGSRLIQISYTSLDPKIAADIVNTLSRELADYTFQTRFNATNLASNWLREQLGDLRKDSEDLQTKVVNLERQSGVYSLGSTDADGREQSYSTVLDQLQQATQALTLAQQDRILKGAISQAAETGNAEMLSGLAGNTLPSSSGSSGVSTVLNLIQSLRQQEALQVAAIKQSEVKFGPSYPKMGELQGNLAALQQSITQEIDRIKGRAKSDYEIAANKEASTRAAFDKAKEKADTLNDKAIEYVILRQEASESRMLYEDLLKRLKEAGVLEGLKSSNITVVDPGRVPAKPKIPNIPLYLGLAVAGGSFLGCCGALLADSVENKVINVQELEEMFNLPILGVLPNFERPQNSTSILAVEDPHSTYIEAIRSIRTALLLSRTDAPPKVLLIVSSIAAEGKSSCAINLATVFAQSGRRTLLVDTDLRRGTLRHRFGLPNGHGLSDLLAGQQATPPIQPAPGVENLDILIAGTPPPNPTDLLESDTMKKWLQTFRSEYDFIVLDSAPVLPVPDSLALNILADATLLLVRSRLTERPQVERSYRILTRNGKHYVGLVLNGLSTDESSYYGYYGYRKYGYRYAENDNGKK